MSHVTPSIVSPIKFTTATADSNHYLWRSLYLREFAACAYPPPVPIDAANPLATHLDAQRENVFMQQIQQANNYQQQSRPQQVSQQQEGNPFHGKVSEAEQDAPFSMVLTTSEGDLHHSPLLSVSEPFGKKNIASTDVPYQTVKQILPSPPPPTLSVEYSFSKERSDGNASITYSPLKRHHTAAAGGLEAFNMNSQEAIVQKGGQLGLHGASGSSITHLSVAPRPMGAFGSQYSSFLSSRNGGGGVVGGGGNSFSPNGDSRSPSPAAFNNTISLPMYPSFRNNSFAGGSGSGGDLPNSTSQPQHQTSFLLSTNSFSRRGSLRRIEIEQRPSVLQQTVDPLTLNRRGSLRRMELDRHASASGGPRDDLSAVGTSAVEGWGTSSQLLRGISSASLRGSGRAMVGLGAGDNDGGDYHAFQNLMATAWWVASVAALRSASWPLLMDDTILYLNQSPLTATSQHRNLPLNINSNDENRGSFVGGVSQQSASTSNNNNAFVTALMTLYAERCEAIDHAHADAFDEAFVTKRNAEVLNEENLKRIRWGQKPLKRLPHSMTFTLDHLAMIRDVAERLGLIAPVPPTATAGSYFSSQSSPLGRLKRAEPEVASTEVNNKKPTQRLVTNNSSGTSNFFIPLPPTTERARECSSQANTVPFDPLRPRPPPKNSVSSPSSARSSRTCVTDSNPFAHTVTPPQLPLSITEDAMELARSKRRKRVPTALSGSIQPATDATLPLLTNTGKSGLSDTVGSVLFTTTDDDGLLLYANHSPLTKCMEGPSLNASAAASPFSVSSQRSIVSPRKTVLLEEGAPPTPQKSKMYRGSDEDDVAPPIMPNLLLARASGLRSGSSCPVGDARRLASPPHHSNTAAPSSMSLTIQEADTMAVIHQQMLPFMLSICDPQTLAKFKTNRVAGSNDECANNSSNSSSFQSTFVEEQLASSSFRMGNRNRNSLPTIIPLLSAAATWQEAVARRRQWQLSSFLFFLVKDVTYSDAHLIALLSVIESRVRSHKHQMPIAENIAPSDEEEVKELVSDVPSQRKRPKKDANQAISSEIVHQALCASITVSRTSAGLRLLEPIISFKTQTPLSNETQIVSAKSQNISPCCPLVLMEKTIYDLAVVLEGTGPTSSSVQPTGIPSSPVSHLPITSHSRAVSAFLCMLNHFTAEAIQPSLVMGSQSAALGSTADSISTSGGGHHHQSLYPPAPRSLSEVEFNDLFLLIDWLSTRTNYTRGRDVSYPYEESMTTALTFSQTVEVRLWALKRQQQRLEESNTNQARAKTTAFNTSSSRRQEHNNVSVTVPVIYSSLFMTPFMLFTTYARPYVAMWLRPVVRALAKLFEKRFVGSGLSVTISRNTKRRVEELETATAAEFQNPFLSPTNSSPTKSRPRLTRDEAAAALKDQVSRIKTIAKNEQRYTLFYTDAQLQHDKATVINAVESQNAATRQLLALQREKEGHADEESGVKTSTSTGRVAKGDRKKRHRESSVSSTSSLQRTGTGYSRSTNNEGGPSAVRRRQRKSNERRTLSQKNVVGGHGPTFIKPIDEIDSLLCSRSNSQESSNSTSQISSVSPQDTKGNEGSSTAPNYGRLSLTSRPNQHPFYTYNRGNTPAKSASECSPSTRKQSSATNPRDKQVTERDSKGIADLAGWITIPDTIGHREQHILGSIEAAFGVFIQTLYPETRLLYNDTTLYKSSTCQQGSIDTETESEEVDLEPSNRRHSTAMVDGPPPTSIGQLLSSLPTPLVEMLSAIGSAVYAHLLSSLVPSTTLGDCKASVQRQMAEIRLRTGSNTQSQQGVETELLVDELVRSIDGLHRRQQTGDSLPKNSLPRQHREQRDISHHLHLESDEESTEGQKKRNVQSGGRFKSSSLASTTKESRQPPIGITSDDLSSVSQQSPLLTDIKGARLARLLLMDSLIIPMLRDPIAAGIACHEDDPNKLTLAGGTSTRHRRNKSGGGMSRTTSFSTTRNTMQRTGSMSTSRKNAASLLKQLTVNSKSHKGTKENEQEPTKPVPSTEEICIDEHSKKNFFAFAKYLQIMVNAPYASRRVGPVTEALKASYGRSKAANDHQQTVQPPSIISQGQSSPSNQKPKAPNTMIEDTNNPTSELTSKAKQVNDHSSMSTSINSQGLLPKIITTHDVTACLQGLPPPSHLPPYISGILNLTNGRLVHRTSFDPSLLLRHNQTLLKDAAVARRKNNKAVLHDSREQEDDTVSNPALTPMLPQLQTPLYHLTVPIQKFDKNHPTSGFVTDASSGLQEADDDIRSPPVAAPFDSDEDGSSPPPPVTRGRAQTKAPQPPPAHLVATSPTPNRQRGTVVPMIQPQQHLIENEVLKMDETIEEDWDDECDYVAEYERIFNAAEAVKEQRRAAAIARGQQGVSGSNFTTPSTAPLQGLLSRRGSSAAKGVTKDNIQEDLKPHAITAATNLRASIFEGSVPSISVALHTTFIQQFHEAPSSPLALSGPLRKLNVRLGLLAPPSLMLRDTAAGPFQNPPSSGVGTTRPGFDNRADNSSLLVPNEIFQRAVICKVYNEVGQGGHLLRNKVAATRATLSPAALVTRSMLAASRMYVGKEGGNLETTAVRENVSRGQASKSVNEPYQEGADTLYIYDEARKWAKHQTDSILSASSKVDRPSQNRQWGVNDVTQSREISLGQSLGHSLSDLQKIEVRIELASSRWRRALPPYTSAASNSLHTAMFPTSAVQPKTIESTHQPSYGVSIRSWANMPSSSDLVKVSTESLFAVLVAHHPCLDETLAVVDEQTSRSIQIHVSPQDRRRGAKNFTENSASYLDRLKATLVSPRFVNRIVNNVMSNCPALYAMLFPSPIAEGGLKLNASSLFGNMILGSLPALPNLQTLLRSLAHGNVERTTLDANGAYALQATSRPIPTVIETKARLMGIGSSLPIQSLLRNPGSPNVGAQQTDIPMTDIFERWWTHMVQALCGRVCLLVVESAPDSSEQWREAVAQYMSGINTSVRTQLAEVSGMLSNPTRVQETQDQRTKPSAYAARTNASAQEISKAEGLANVVDAVLASREVSEAAKRAMRFEGGGMPKVTLALKGLRALDSEVKAERSL